MTTSHRNKQNASECKIGRSCEVPMSHGTTDERGWCGPGSKDRNEANQLQGTTACPWLLISVWRLRNTLETGSTREALRTGVRWLFDVWPREHERPTHPAAGDAPWHVNLFLGSLPRHGCVSSARAGALQGRILCFLIPACSLMVAPSRNKRAHRGIADHKPRDDGATVGFVLPPLLKIEEPARRVALAA